MIPCFVRRWILNIFGGKSRLLILVNCPHSPWGNCYGVVGGGGGGEGAYMAYAGNCRCTVVQRLALSSGSVLSEVYDHERIMDPLLSLDITS